MAFVLRQQCRRTQPEGLRHHSPGQRPGVSCRTTQCSLKGCDTRLSQPFRLAADWADHLFPGRCPGLWCLSPSGCVLQLSAEERTRAQGFLHSTQRGEVGESSSRVRGLWFFLFASFIAFLTLGSAYDPLPEPSTSVVCPFPRSIQLRGTPMLTDRVLLLRSIIANPAENTPRLMFADYL